jgi:hypothetical protein
MEPIPYQKNLQSSVKNQPVPMDDVEFDQLVGMIKDSMSESVDEPANTQEFELAKGFDFGDKSKSTTKSTGQASAAAKKLAIDTADTYFQPDHLHNGLPSPESFLAGILSPPSAGGASALAPPPPFVPPSAQTKADHAAAMRMSEAGAGRVAMQFIAKKASASALPPSFESTSLVLEEVCRFNLPMQAVSEQRALSKPLFRRDGLVVAGTDEAAAVASKKGGSFMFLATTGPGEALARMQRMPPQTGPRPPAMLQSTHRIAIAQQVRDLQWVKDSLVLCAIGGDMALLQLPPMGVGLDYFEPGLHILSRENRGKNDIREMAVNPSDPSLVAAGGFDRRLYLSHLDCSSAEQPDICVSQNFAAPGVVSSILWAAASNMESVISCTTDSGHLCTFDTRLSAQQKAATYNSHVQGMYCHEYLNDSTVALGFGSGIVQILDLRKMCISGSFHNPHTTAIGEMRKWPSQFGDPSGTRLAFFGHSEFSVWDVNVGSAVSTTMRAHHRPAPIAPTQPRSFYKTSGNFLPWDNQVGTTDSDGNLSLWSIVARR